MPAQTPHELPALFAELFNQGDPSSLYEPGAEPEVLAGHLELDAKMEVSPRKVLVNGDIALLVVDWRLGEVTGTATDVARRGPDGWRYVIDNPSGVA
ncbi:hypothetical protein GCM10010492_42880 [Saccharothrix mutabilis subsp. mutabilis]|uniref:DUF4440 domain-containing protein n=1 Tax=Saccharothrix mutabilis subsp. mutabilis TaxID=66855 RepID=A0ABN0U5M0_9PSEU